MTGFSADWLALREPLDMAARNPVVEDAFVEALPRNAVSLLDLASGAGSTVAGLCAKIPQRQSWRLTDNDGALLKIAQRRFAERPHITIVAQEADLSRELSQLPFSEMDGVTTSAFLDLVTRPFLEELVHLVAQARIPFLASLTYDGRSTCWPEDDLDDPIRLAMNKHQRTDKGFGAALGPEAVAVTDALFKAAGYRTVIGRSDWKAGPGHAGFIDQLLAGWVSAAVETGLDEKDLDPWRALRRKQIAEGVLRIEVGHQDFAALPV